MNWLMNHGTGTIAWLNLLSVLVVIGFAAWLAKDLYSVIMSVNKEDGKWKPMVKPAIVKALVLTVVVFGIYAAMGPGTPPMEIQSDIGVMEYVDKAPDMKTQEQIDREAEARKDPFLKKQDQGFQAEKEEADAILDEARKRHQNQ